MKKEELVKLLSLSWTKETCVPSLKEIWNKDNPSIGQCAITSLILNDFFGGQIMRCMCNNDSHYYNIIDNKIIDMTVGQFNGIIPDYENGSERSREYLLSNSDTKKRYLLLLDNVINNTKKLNIKVKKLER